jgi:beta-glucosidase
VWRYNWFQFGWEHESAVWPHREEALRIAAEADAVVYCTGHSRFSEGENSDRTFAMPPEAEALLLDVLEANPNTAVVLNGGGNIDMRRWLDRTRAVLHAWYPGQEGGTAVADILFGKVNPSGKLPATFERAWEDRSSFGCYHDADGDKRVFFADGVFGGYRHVDRYGIEPAFPFGFGLSYTTFEYENLRLSAESIERGQELRVQFDVVNTGDRAGAEVAQLYVHDRQASVGRPVKELKSYERIELDPGERATVQITLAEDALSFWHPERGEWMAEPGEFEVRIGASSRDIRLRGAFALIG